MKTPRSLAMALLFATTTASHALSIFWGGPVFGNYFTSDGTTQLDSANFTIELGTFDAEFDPAAASMDDWSSAWNTMDTTPFDDTFMYFDSSVMIDELGHSDGTGADANYDFRGSQVYLWVYDTRESPLDAATMYEWAVLSGADWKIPANTNDPFALPLQFRTDNATSTLIGATDSNGDGQNVLSSTVGYYTAPSGAYDMQTYSVHMATVPEVSSLVFFQCGLLALCSRRKRS